MHLFAKTMMGASLKSFFEDHGLSGLAGKIRELIEAAVRSDQCTKINCTTCGALEFRSGIWSALLQHQDIASRRVRRVRGLTRNPARDVRELFDITARITTDGVRNFVRALGRLETTGPASEGLVSCLRCILYDLWNFFPDLKAEIEHILKGTQAGEILAAMQSHHAARIADQLAHRRRMAEQERQRSFRRMRAADLHRMRIAASARRKGLFSGSHDRNVHGCE